MLKSLCLSFIIPLSLLDNSSVDPLLTPFLPPSLAIFHHLSLHFFFLWLLYFYEQIVLASKGPRPRTPMSKVKYREKIAFSFSLFIHSPVDTATMPKPQRTSLRLTILKISEP